MIPNESIVLQHMHMHPMNVPSLTMYHHAMAIYGSIHNILLALVILISRNNSTQISRNMVSHEVNMAPNACVAERGSAINISPNNAVLNDESYIAARRVGDHTATVCKSWNANS
jgi:hypothetical protein